MSRINWYKVGALTALAVVVLLVFSFLTALLSIGTTTPYLVAVLESIFILLVGAGIIGLLGVIIWCLFTLGEWLSDWADRKHRDREWKRHDEWRNR